MRLIKFFSVIGVLLVGLVVFGAGSALAGGSDGVYYETNSEPTNYVQSYTRNGDGTLNAGPLVSTGGSGEDQASPFAPHGFPLVDSANAVGLNDDGKLLFVVNAGSDTISSFVVGSHGLELADQISSHGDLPVSLTVTNHGPGHTLVYVLNEWSGNIAGFTAENDGDLHYVSGSTRSLSVPGPDGAAATVGFDSEGKTLTVSQRGAILDPVTGQYIGTGPDLLDVFKVDGHGVAGPAIQSPSIGEDPFGFAYTKRDQLVMADAGLFGTATTYDLNQHSGGLTPLAHVPTNGVAPCWVVLSKNDKYAYITNSLNNTVPAQSTSRFAVGHDGQLTFLGLTQTTFNAALDEDSSDNGKFLYILNTLVVPDPDMFHFHFIASRVDQFRIENNGGLTFIGTTDPVPFGGSSGLAAH